MASSSDPTRPLSKEPPWWETFFDEVYGLNILERISPEKTEAQVDFILRELDLKSGGLCFDQCCGRGRISLGLAGRGCRAVGVDCIDSYIAHASAQAEQLNLDCEFIVGDARAFVPNEPCDAALNWFTSFGYSDCDTSNLEMLKRGYESLRSGGSFALDYMNMGYVLQNFQERRVDIMDREDEDSFVIVQESKLDLATGVLHGDWTFFSSDNRRSRQSMQVKTYFPDQLRTMLESCGFERVRFFGNVSGAPLSLETPRCICICEKPSS